MKIKKVDSLAKEDLVYKILDQQAIDAANEPKPKKKGPERKEGKKEFRKEEHKPIAKEHKEVTKPMAASQVVKEPATEVKSENPQVPAAKQEKHHQDDNRGKRQDLSGKKIRYGNSTPINPNKNPRMRRQFCYPRLMMRLKQRSPSQRLQRC